MAAYAALVSLTHILDQILHPPPLHQIIIVREQIESQQEKVGFLKIIPVDEAKKSKIWRRRSQMQLMQQRISLNPIKMSSTLLCEGIQTVIEKSLSIEKELVKIKGKKGMGNLQSKSSTIVTSSRPLPSDKSTMVGFHKHLIQIMSALSTEESNLQILPIVGMGGIGKTILAANVYSNPYIVEHFQMYAWVTISQEYCVSELLLGLLHHINEVLTDPNKQEKSEDLATFIVKMSRKSDDQLGELPHKKLFERKYLIVMDDMWNIQAWDEVKLFLPDNDNGSRILVTTRLLKLAVAFGSCSPYEMDFLDEEHSWDLLREKVFVQEGCPVELEEIGKNIAKRCGGLPLALVVIGGLLAKSESTRKQWKYVEGDVTSAVNCGNDEHFMKILSLSYNHLPIYLKPCFLYLVVFSEDFEIRVSGLIRLWVAEGLIKATSAKSLEEVAEEYLRNLIDRNLILVLKRGSSGKLKTCSIHDLLRDLCRREAHKNKFLRIGELDNPNISLYTESERRISIHYSTSEERVCETLQSAALNRPFLCYFYWASREITHSFSLLRVLDVADQVILYDGILQLINLRYISCIMKEGTKLSSISLLGNLQTLVVDEYLILPREIWQMSQLRHLKIKGVLENLQTLSKFKHFRCPEHVFKRIPNLKKLGITYGSLSKGYRYYRLSNLIRFHKLELLALQCHENFWGNIAIPNMSMVGSLPNLEVLKLLPRAAKAQNLVSRQHPFFHFPSLERLILRHVGLKEIPMGFAEIPTLQVIKLHWTTIHLSESRKRISEERERLGYRGLQRENNEFFNYLTLAGNSLCLFLLSLAFFYFSIKSGALEKHSIRNNKTFYKIYIVV
ncbi:hypothetical protein Pfo_020342 [Paulownia fortunei]|nr:hypothetical protein Pfo_020342 [Paulownia fortunei]